MIGWWDCGAGASGDMCLGALADVGVPLDVMQAAVDAVGTERVTLESDTVERQGVVATKVEVRAPRTAVVRTWANIRGLLERAELEDTVRTVALDAFSRLAGAEAQAHRSSPEQVHFHEVGGLDAIADIVGTAAGLHALGLERLTASPVALGTGMVRGEHGLLPVPVPAVLALLGDAGAPVAGGPAPYEMCTPTGAALLAATVGAWGPLPPMRVRGAGAGAGGRNLDEVPNVLRLVVGVAADAPAAETLVLETNVDDLDPRLWPAVLSRLLDAGASDAWLTPILMKKGRPANTLSVLLPGEHAAAIRRVVFTETSAIGLREHAVSKTALERAVLTVEVGGVPVRVKVASLDGEVVNAQPEYDDVAAAAARLARPIKTVLAAAVAQAHQAVWPHPEPVA
jgi:uncharacterized protein (TIGR00299 family) protein